MSTSTLSSHPRHTYDLVGVGLGPFNLSLAALLHPLEQAGELNTLFLEQQPQFDWHPGMLLPGTTLQVPFLADLVTMAAPTSAFSYLNYLHEKGRLYSFYFREHFLVPRNEYNRYCQWVSSQLPSCQFGTHVKDMTWQADKGCFKLHYQTEHGEQTVYARHVVLGIGSSPSLPKPLKDAAHAAPERIFHTAHLLKQQKVLEAISAHQHVTVLGSGQSAAEAFQHMLSRQGTQGFQLDWFTRSAGFFPMEYSKLGLQHFTPDYIQYIRSLPQATRDTLIPSQGLLYKGISATTLAEIYDTLYERTIENEPLPVQLRAHLELSHVVENAPGQGWTLHFYHNEQQRHYTTQTDLIIAGTGYQPTQPMFMEGLNHLIEYDEQDRYQIDDQYRLHTTVSGDHRIYVQNAELHTHGIGAPDLGLGAHRASVIINDLLGYEAYKVREKNSILSFGVPENDNELEQAV